MCNCKGWDIAYYPDEITVEQHFCRDLGDCGHVDNTLEEAADEVAAAYDREHDWYADAMQRDLAEHSTEHLDKLMSESLAWKNRTHPSYLYYANPVDNEEDSE